MKNKKPDNNNFKFLVSVPVPIKQRLEEEAKGERRNRNAQIIRILEERYEIAPSAKPSQRNS